MTFTRPIPRQTINRTLVRSERSLLETVVALSQATGWLAYHTFDSRKSNPGFPDLVLVHEERERVLFAELKSERGVLSLAQRAWLDALRSTGVETYVWRWDDWDEIEATLTRRGKGTGDA